MFARHAIRLIRKRWANAMQLAQELFAIFSQDDLPLEHRGPVTFTKPETGELPLTFRGFSSGDTLIRIDRGDDDPLDIGFDDDGQLRFPGRADEADEADESQEDEDEQETTREVFLGTVQSGTGSTYEVLLDNGDVVTATQQQIASGEEVPAGTVAPVFLIDGQYKMQVPVWVE